MPVCTSLFTHTLYVYSNTQSASIPMPDRQSGTCLDMRAFDGQSEQPMIHMTDSSIHHVLDDNMFTPRKTVGVPTHINVFIVCIHVNMFRVRKTIPQKPNT